MCGLWSLEAKNETEKTPTHTHSLSLSHSWKKDATNHVRISICTKYITTTTTTKEKKPMKKSNGFL
jgi:hypothetical protein